MLQPLNECINEEVYEMYQDIPKREVGSRNIINGVSYDEFLNICKKYIEDETIIDNDFNTTTKRYILYIDNYPVGEVGIRTTLNDFWINQGSQIFYKIRTDSRGRGYGSLILKLALEEAKKLGFEKVRINCSDDNIPSKKIIVKNGGIVDIKNYQTQESTSSSYIIYIK